MSPFPLKNARQPGPVTLSDGRELRFSPGKHGKLQAAIVKDFAPRVIEKPKVLYFGKTGKKGPSIDLLSFCALHMEVTDHDKLPDIVLLDSARNWLFLIEAVTSHGPMNPKRVLELKKMFKNCGCGNVFVTAFSDFAEFKRHSNEISWETEVWIADNPGHMIHYNGDRFMGPR